LGKAAGMDGCDGKCGGTFCWDTQAWIDRNPQTEPATLLLEGCLAKSGTLSNKSKPRKEPKNIKRRNGISMDWLRENLQETTICHRKNHDFL